MSETAANATALPQPSTTRPSWLSLLLVLTLLVVGAVFRLHDLGAEGFDYDEVYAVRVPGLSIRALGTVMARDTLRTNHPFLMTVPYTFWTGLVGVNETAVRILPFLLGLLAIVLMYLLGRDVGGNSVGLFAAGWLAITPLHIAYSQEARHYALLVVLVLSAHLLLVRSLRGGSAPVRALYALVCWLAFFTHYFAVMALTAHGVLGLWLVFTGTPEVRRNAYQTLGALALAIVPLLAWAPILPHQASRPWGHLEAGDFSTILWCFQDATGLGKGWVALLPTLMAFLVIAVGLHAGRQERLASKSTDIIAPFSRWLGWCLLVGGLVVGVGLLLATPRLVWPAARVTLSQYETDPTIIDTELHLLRYLLTAMPLSLAVVGLLILGWRPLVELGSRWPHTVRERPLTVAQVVAAFLLVPLLTIRLVALFGVPFVQPHGMIVLVPAFCLALGQGLGWLWQQRGGTLLVGAAAVALAFGPSQYQAVSALFGADGILLGTHTSTAWTEIAEKFSASETKEPLYMAKTFQTDPALYYLAAQSPRQLRTVEQAQTAKLPPTFHFLHYEDDPTSTAILATLRQRCEWVRTLYEKDQLTLLVVAMPPPKKQRPLW